MHGSFFAGHRGACSMAMRKAARLLKKKTAPQKRRRNGQLVYPEGTLKL
jgi:hypothetical protein